MTLEALERIARDLGAADAASEARASAERVHERRFFVACLGQFKRGKSTLLNALVGAPVLPVGVTPVTAVVTVLRHGRALEARVRTSHEPWRPVAVAELAAFVSEAENPENEKDVTGVEVFVPSPLLASGLCLVDTPGVGSVFEGNTAATRAFVPHVDAALVVLGGDPPISRDELELVSAVAKEVRDFVFVLAKADRLAGEELAQAKAFSEQALGRVVPGASLLEISARERSERGASTRDWDRRAEARVAAALMREIDERRAALQRPHEASALRVESLRVSKKRAERLLADTRPLFASSTRHRYDGERTGRRADV